ncbi:hypothetical protein, conserved [Eimeria necatrix]|uniref:Transmembrane protein n=1 Tax=Eimeria necatrix TaxID=51315 RepID=U6MT83_9EIME|nr:hypothetical protein, conserved [Eimeria necatrix]CDJ67226.1 hypothetical protein, conserved [Eimeria necatrix]
MGEGSAIPRNAKHIPSLMLDGSSRIAAEAQDSKQKAMIRGELSYRPSFFAVVVFVTIAFLILKCAVHLAAHRPKSVRSLAGGDNDQQRPLLEDGSSGSEECDGLESRSSSGARPKEGKRSQGLGWKFWKRQPGRPGPKYKRQKDDDESSPLPKPSTLEEPKQEDNNDSSPQPKPSTSKEPKHTSRRPPTLPLPKPSSSKEPEDASRRPQTFPQRRRRSRLTIKGMRVGDPESSHYDELSLPFSHPLLGIGKRHRGLRNIMEKAGTTASSICFPHTKKIHTHYTAWVSTDGGEEIEVHVEIEEITKKRASPWTRLRMLLSLTHFDHRQMLKKALPQRAREAAPPRSSKGQMVQFARVQFCSKSTPHPPARNQKQKTNNYWSF